MKNTVLKKIYILGIALISGGYFLNLHSLRAAQDVCKNAMSQTVRDSEGYLPSFEGRPYSRDLRTSLWRWLGTGHSGPLTQERQKDLKSDFVEEVVQYLQENFRNQRPDLVPSKAWTEGFAQLEYFRLNDDRSPFALSVTIKPLGLV